MTAKIHDAAAAVLLHEGQVLLVQRHAHLSAFPGYWAFPGGKVDAADRIDGEDLLIMKESDIMGVIAFSGVTALEEIFCLLCVNCAFKGCSK